MSTQKIALAAALAALLATPLTVFSESVIHSANTEMGYTQYPDHSKAGKSRADVQAELKTAMKSPRWDFWSRLGAPLPVPSTAPGKTREEVRSEAITANRTGSIPRGEVSY